MPELRIMIIGSVSGDPESEIKEAIFPYEEGDGFEAAAQAGAWLVNAGQDLIAAGKEMKS